MENEIVYQDEVQEQEQTVPTWIVIIVFIWMILGLLGFVTSIVCFAYDGSFMQNWVGFLTSITLGPFYWIYFAFVGETYCSNSIPKPLQKEIASVKKAVKKSTKPLKLKK